MKFWFSGEVQADVADAYRGARKDVESALNQALGDKSYGPRLAEWDFIAIIRAQDHADYGELKKYDPKDKSLEFRLKIDHARFKAADDLTRRRMLMESVLRSAREAGPAAPRDTKLDELERDLLEVAWAKGWIAQN